MHWILHPILHQSALRPGRHCGRGFWPPALRGSALRAVFLSGGMRVGRAEGRTTAPEGRTGPHAPATPTGDLQRERRIFRRVLRRFFWRIFRRILRRFFSTIISTNFRSADFFRRCFILVTKCKENKNSLKNSRENSQRSSRQNSRRNSQTNSLKNSRRNSRRNSQNKIQKNKQTNSQTSSQKKED